MGQVSLWSPQFSWDDLISAACLILSHLFFYKNKLQGCDKSVGTIFPTAFALSMSGSHFDNSLISHFSFTVLFVTVICDPGC